MKRVPWPERFWAKVDKTDGCWEWTACRTSEGYGDLWTGTKTERAHRLSWVLALGAYRLSELSVGDVDLFLGRGGADAQTVRHWRATLRRALADALRQGLVSRNVAALAHPPRLTHRERTILDANQARLLIESTRGTRYGPLWTILVTTGLRISEALGLAWSDVVLSDVDVGSNPARRSVQLGQTPEVAQALTASGRATLDKPPLAYSGKGGGPSITVRHQLARENGEWVRRQPKTAKGRRTIPLTPLGVEALRAQRAMQREWMADTYEARPNNPRAGGDRDGLKPTAQARATGIIPIDGLVFTSPTGHPLHGTNVVKRLADDLSSAGLPHVTCHDLRHSAATLLYSVGIPLESIADMLGHSTVRVTQDLYRHRVPEMQQAASDAMQRALG